tara:strand:+ start:8897 stop:9532 length:636 start_codon:yes stop_codon:yes gene_type:complete
MVVVGIPMLHKIIVKLVILSSIVFLISIGCLKEEKKEGELLVNKYNEAPSMVIDPNKTYRAIFKTSAGDFTVELFADKVPVTVNNFVFLARDKYYDGTTFHRVIPEFMAQGGDPSGTGMGGPGYRFDDEFDQTLRHDSPGILSMANAGPGTNGSQFFITFVATPHLDDRHAVFGRVIDGLDIALAIEPRDPASSATPGQTLEEVTILESDK